MSQAEKLSITSISINTKNGYKHKSVLLIKGYTSPDIWGEVYRVLPHKLLLTTYYPDQIFLIFFVEDSCSNIKWHFASRIFCVDFSCEQSTFEWIYSQVSFLESIYMFLYSTLICKYACINKTHIFVFWLWHV